jgi:hypothetical protein
MFLFDDIRRTDMGPALHGEPNFAYLNRSARRPFTNVREVLEQWFLRYPDNAKKEFRDRFRDVHSDDNHLSAFFELFLHEHLTGLGCEIGIHPRLESGTRRRPDFLVNSLSGSEFYMEAILATNRSKTDRTIDAHLNDFLRSLERVDSPDFFILIDWVDFEPSNPLPGSKVRKQIRNWLSTLDYEAVVAHAEREPESSSSLPKLSLDLEGHGVTIRAVPKKKDRRGQWGEQSIGSYPIRLEQSIPHLAIRDAVIKKSSRYKSPDLPYVIAVNSLYPFVRRHDCEVALFGLPGPPEPASLERRAFTRLLHGAWTGVSGATRTRVSGVLAARYVLPWTICSTEVILYHNPWASRPITLGIPDFPEAHLRDEGVEYRITRTLGSQLQMPEGWPGSDSD